MSFSINNNFGLGDQLPYADNAQIKNLTKMLPENATAADFFNVYSQEVKSIQLKSLFSDSNDGASIGDDTSSDGSILDSFSKSQFTNPLNIDKSSASLLQFNQDQSGQNDFLSSIQLMEEVQNNTALIGKNVSYQELNNSQIKKGKVEKVIIDNLVPYLVISDGRHLRINDIKEIDNED